MASLTAQFSANRAVREYTEEHYLPAAAAYRGGQPIKAQPAADGQLAAHNWNRIGPHSDSAK